MESTGQTHRVPTNGRAGPSRAGTGHGAPGDEGASEDSARTSRPRPGLISELSALGRDARTYLALTLEEARLAVGARLRGAARGVLALIFATAFIAASTWLLLDGLAGAVADALGSPWAGRVVVGGGALLLLAAGVAVAERRRDAQETARLRRRYGDRARPAGDEAPPR